MTPTLPDPSVAESYIRRRVRAAALLSACSALCYGALVLGMAAWPQVLRRFWGSELYSLGMALVVVNVGVGAVLSLLYVWWMPRQFPARSRPQRDA